MGLSRKNVSTIFALLIVSTLALALKIQPVNATGPIYIRADGSIDPPTAPIQRHGNVYTLTGNITSDADGIVVERDNIVVDGSGFAIEGTGTLSSNGTYLFGRSDVTIQNTNIKNFSYGIKLANSSNNSMNGNTITNSSYYGIMLYWSSKYNSIGGNTIANNSDGIDLYDSSNYNRISENTITNNSGYGIRLIWYANNNSISENTITDNYCGIWLESSSNYNSISENNITNNDYGIGLGYSSNNTVCYNNFIDNTVQVSDWTPGYPNFWDNGYEGNFWSNYNGTDLNRDGIGDTPYIIEVNNRDRYPLMSIIPEFPSLLIPALFMTATLLAVIVYKRKHTSKVNRI